MKIKLYLEELRAPFFTASIIPVILGTLIAWHITGTINWTYFILTLIGGILLHAGTNVANDYFDHKSGNDEANTEYIRPFTGGSRLIQKKLLTPKEVLSESLICFALGSLIGLYLYSQLGVFILVLGLIGIISGFFYCAPPFKWVHRGIGELIVGLNFGTLMCLGAYYVQTQTISIVPVIASLPVALLIALVLYINEFPDYNADKSVGKNHLVIRFGKEKAVTGYIIAMVMVYVIIIAGVLSGAIPILGLSALLTLTLAIKAMKTLKENFAGPSLKLLPANALTVQLHLLIGLLLSISYFIR
ncbi:MAG: 1,4-dihydroxy-2-naphthoate octaprenyltransferase [Candidatus Firestonebacteria bacterium]